MGVHESFAALQAAERQAARARRLFSEAATHAAGIELAERRLVTASGRLAQATFTLTRARPLYEVVWALPDDL